MDCCVVATMTTNLGIQSFSPTQTNEYAFCPRAWGFYRAGLKPKCISYPEIAAITGTTVALGLQEFYEARKTGLYGPPNIVLAIYFQHIMNDVRWTV